MLISLKNKENQEKGQVHLNPTVFEAEIAVPLMHQVVKMQLAKRRSGDACTKTRGEVSGGGKKPWKQKGTGRARAGSSRSPVWVGGGTIFGPRPRSYDFSVPKQMRKTALKSALSVKAKDGQITLVEEFNVDEPKTKVVANYLKALGLVGKKVLILDQAINPNLYKSIRNLPNVDVLPVEGLNLYDLLWHEQLVITQAALEKIGERLG
ncbi:MAG: 50S ribosomal protein L4 [Candidatus Schekmanbacteria bacterium]|nr:50S ribosomal protein L4 [Candidatus Schekmanbacteria bacterium]